MSETMRARPAGIEKRPTGVRGLDELLGGGLPAGRTTLVAGGPGAGKTVLTLQALVHGARELGEPGIFVAFEESAANLRANVASFGWSLSELEDKQLFFLDAQPQPEWVQSGKFDLNGLLAGLDQRVQDMGARRIAFDAIDVVLTLMDDRRSIQQQVHRLDDWLAERGLTALLTYKLGALSELAAQLEFLQFMVDCSIELAHEMIDGVAHRALRIVKYRGASFEENPAPFVIGGDGMQVALSKGHEEPSSSVSTERVSSGVEALDSMLGGGYFRGASILITGAPGTAKTTLAGAFSKAACERGENTLFVSFDSRADEIVRNLKSVGIDLEPAIDDGRLRMATARSVSGSAESHLMKIQREAVDHEARCVVIDPVSALAKRGNTRFAHSVIERLIDWAKNQQLTLFCSSLMDRSRTELEGTPLQISTIADTWIHLDYQESAGERNRGLSIIKSRGTGHSNQVRELVLGDDGVALADVYTAGGEVLMGALRYEKEREEQAAEARQAKQLERRRLELDAETAELEARLQAVSRELEARQAERRSLLESEEEQVDKARETSRQVRRMRGGDGSAGSSSARSSGRSSNQASAEPSEGGDG